MPSQSVPFSASITAAGISQHQARASLAQPPPLPSESPAICVRHHASASVCVAISGCCTCKTGQATLNLSPSGRRLSYLTCFLHQVSVKGKPQVSPAGQCPCHCQQCRQQPCSLCAGSKSVATSYQHDQLDCLSSQGQSPKVRPKAVQSRALVAHVSVIRPAASRTAQRRQHRGLWALDSMHVHGQTVNFCP